uniref:Uncharacterized protein n=1 Tax=Anguilla anguilla TaxID=7936 RepID=A0A0E9SZ78_ANGAN
MFAPGETLGTPCWLQVETSGTPCWLQGEVLA